MRLKLGSLFDGSGGFPLAGAINGIEPVWASEIEPYPIRVTKARFPQMKHLGSVLDVNGAEVEPVDIITFGSPCQDLSVAGKQAGLHKGERSNLFFEAIRIIKEMREATNGTYPRIAVWENVPGAFSSNKGEDFRSVLEAFVRCCDETVSIPRPANGKWTNAGVIVGNGFSVAYRTFDAQFWGVPQRRKRIYLIADFGSERAGEILFEPESVRRDSAACGEAGQGAAADAERGAGGSGIFNESGQGYWMSGVGCIRAEGENRPSRPGHCVVTYAFMGGQGSNARSIAWTEEATPPLKSVLSGSNTVPDVCYPIDLIRESGGAFEAYEENAQASGALKQSDYKGAQVVAFEPGISQRIGVRAFGRGCAYGLTTKGNGDAFIAEERHMALSCGGGQAGQGYPAIIYVLQGNGIDRADTAGCNGAGWREGECYTLNTIDRPAVCYPAADAEGIAGGSGGAVAFGYPVQGTDLYNHTLTGDKAASLNANSGASASHAGPGVCYAIDSLSSNSMKSPNPNSGFHEEEIAKCLDTSGGNPACNQGGNVIVQQPCYPIDSHQQDSRFKVCADGMSPTLPGQMGTGGNNAPMVLEVEPVVYAGGSVTSKANGQNPQPGDPCPTLHNDSRNYLVDPVVNRMRGFGDYEQDDTCSAVKARDYKDATDLVVASAKPPRKYIIRRLTPLECCRLQGFPDWWEDGVQGSDSARYKMWGNGIALPNAAHVVRQAKRLLTSK